MGAWMSRIGKINMDREVLKKRIKELGYKKVVLLVLAGVCLLLLSIPGKQKNDRKEEKTQEEQVDDYVERMEKKLENVLGKVEGMGKVKVMITAKSSKEQVVLKDSPSEKSQEKTRNEGGELQERLQWEGNETTVMQEGEGGENSPYVTKELQPEIEGVVVIAQGLVNAKIEKEINDAVGALFSVPSHKIKVMKMK